MSFTLQLFSILFINITCKFNDVNNIFSCIVLTPRYICHILYTDCENRGNQMALSEGIKRGTVELLILTILQDQDMYGYQLSQELANRSKGLYTLQESSMYPTLYRLVEKELISGRQEKVGKRRVRIYYHLEESGKIYLKTIRKEYCSICRGILYILGIEDMKELEE